MINKRQPDFQKRTGVLKFESVAAGGLQFADHQTGKTFLYRYVFGKDEWLDLLPDGRFDASPEGMKYLSYTETEEDHQGNLIQLS